MNPKQPEASAWWLTGVERENVTDDSPKTHRDRVAKRLGSGHPQDLHELIELE